MPININNPNPVKKESLLDKISKAADIAATGFGIYTNIEKLNLAKTQQEQQAAKEESLRSQMLSDKQSQLQAETQSKKELSDYETKNKKDYAKFEAGIRAPKPAEEPKGDQFKVATFGKRAEQAEQVFGGLAEGGYNRSDAWSASESFLPGVAQSGSYKQQVQAEDNFLNAVLRRESGASISPDERSSGERQYFPRAGDDGNVLAQKAANREIVIQGLKAEAGPAWDRLPNIKVADKKASGNSDGIKKAMADGGNQMKVVNGRVYLKQGDGWKGL